MTSLLVIPFTLGAIVAGDAYAQGTTPPQSPVVGQSINMVTGTQWPTGDPFLERQNEPSMAVSSRNPLHLVAGNNDYRTVDLPGLDSDEPTGDAWLGFFTSMDGGKSWQSTLVPGYPQELPGSPGRASPLWNNYAAAADPTVRAGTNGLIYYSGLAFNRDTGTQAGASGIFVARYIDDNNLQGANTIRYLGTKVIATGDATHFADKPVIAVDMPRGSATCTIPGNSTVPAATIPAGRIYVAYTLFSGGESSSQSVIMLTWSSDCGATWTTPQKISRDAQSNQSASLAIDPKNGNLYIVWRVFTAGRYTDSLSGVNMQYGTNTFTPMLNYPISPFDQATGGNVFRTNAYPSIAVDDSQRLYVAWSQRNSPGAPSGDARIQVIAGVPVFHGNSTAVTGFNLSNPITVDPNNTRGHQIMPALAYSSGKLTVAWYDFRNTDKVAVYAGTSPTDAAGPQLIVPNGVQQFFDLLTTKDAPPPAWRQTVDVRAAQAPPSVTPQFSASRLVSQYSFGTPVANPNNIFPNDPDVIQQLQFDPPNLPLFQLGTVPFVGDYIDVAGPTFVFDTTTQKWRFNNLVTDPDNTRVVWTDNRNVVQPADGNWSHFTPVGSNGDTSLFDPSQTSPGCIAGQTGIRNQDIYTATLSPGVVMGAKGNSKQLSATLKREFPVTIENPTNQARYYRLTFQSQPVGGSASFLQYALLTELIIGVPPLSSASRSVFITSTDPNATVAVNAVEVVDTSGSVVPAGLTSSVTLNGDVSNPNISNPNISNLEIYNPNISNPNISNPNIVNPNISNPNISNPNISNVTYANPNISNPNISNPNISNPNISNPNISNPNISNTALTGDITDANYTVTNSGNTATTYLVNLLQYQPLPTGVTAQLIISGVYLTPVATACTLTVQANYTPVANITNPTFQTIGSAPSTVTSNPSVPSFSLEPGEQAIITLRVYAPDSTQAMQAIAGLGSVVSSQAINTNVTPPGTPPPVLAITTAALSNASLSTNYNAQLLASGGITPYTWSASSLPAGISIQGNSLVGIPTAAGKYTVNIQVSDASGQTAQKTLLLTVDAAAQVAIGTTTLPSGRFSLPYSSTVSATGGTLPYHWSLASGGVLPAGMSIDPNSGVISGTPGEAGQWTVPVVVTDSASSPNSTTAYLPLSIGLATAYSSAPQNGCQMPYPATPLYLQGATTGLSVDTSKLQDATQMYLLNGNVLTGCLTGSDAASVPLTVTGGTGSFTLNLPVVSQVPDNGIVHINTPPFGVPPEYLQQGVVAPGTGFPLSNPLDFPSDIPAFAADTGFSGNFLFGFESSAPQLCTASNEGLFQLIAPASAGRFDILFNGTTQSCTPISMPSTSPTLTVASVDAISSTVSFHGATVSNVNISSPNAVSNSPGNVNVLDVFLASSGSTIPVTLSFNYTVDLAGCANSGCVVQIEYGVNSDSGPQGCAFNGTISLPPAAGPASVTVNVPNQPGRYYIGIDKSLEFASSCSDGQVPQSWWSGRPDISRAIAIVNVWGQRPG